MTTNEIIKSLGIEIEGRYPSAVYWTYNGVRIERPSFRSMYEVVKKEFGIDCELLKESK